MTSAFHGIGSGPDGHRRSVAELFSLKGRVALVTGAARGLGLNMAAALAEAGAITYINGRDEARLALAVTALADQGIVVRPCCFDVTDHAAAALAVDRIAAETGRLDILVNNVGMRMRRPLGDIGPDEMRLMLEANLVAPYHLTKCAAQQMKRHSYGRIIMMTSVAATRARAGDAAYIAAKGGLVSLMRALAAEYGPDGVTCNALSPGRFTTETNTPAGGQPPPAGPLGRWGDPWEIAGACVFLASAAASFVTGETLTVDGGISACG